MDDVRVVVVDDSEELRELVSLMIESATRGRWKVVGLAGDGAEGIEVVRAAQPDLVVLDVAMPVMDGLEALPHIRKAAPQARVAILTAFSTAVVQHAAAAGGAAGCLVKDDLFRTLLPRLQELMGGPTPEPLVPRARAAEPGQPGLRDAARPEQQVSNPTARPSA